jgi:hypothetical protein
MDMPNPHGETGHGVRIVRQPLLVVALITLTLSARTDAGIFKRSAKPDPATHVPALLDMLKSATDERDRVAAANALREYDAKVYPEILPALMDALAGDSSSSVRAEAAESMGRIRPITAQAGYALEQAKEHDKDRSVRTSARLALLQYKILGWIPGTKAEIAFQTKEPPLASESVKSVPSTTVLRPTPSPALAAGPVSPPSVKPLQPAAPPGPELIAPKQPETSEPPVADPSKRSTALVSQPKAPVPVIVIPTLPVRESVVPSVPKPQPVLPAPKDLPPDLGKSADKPPAKPSKPTEEGPTLGPPPK